MIRDEAGIESSLSHAQGGTIRWMSPELLDPERFGLADSRPTMESDCYALGVVMYEVLSGQKPFAQCREPAVIRKVIDGERPERPQGAVGAWFVDDVWGMVERCWESRPENRPDVGAVLQCLERVSERFRSPPPRTEGYWGVRGISIDDHSYYFTAVDISGMFPVNQPHHFTPSDVSGTFSRFFIGTPGSSHDSLKSCSERFSAPGSLANR